MCPEICVSGLSQAELFAADLQHQKCIYHLIRSSAYESTCNIFHHK
jgi:hypothetical protein